MEIQIVTIINKSKKSNLNKLPIMVILEMREVPNVTLYLLLEGTMNLVKKSLVSMGLLAVFACSAAIAYAAPISFETSSTQIVFDNKKGKWASQAYTKGSYGTQYSRTYTEIYGDGYKRDWKNMTK